MQRWIDALVVSNLVISLASCGLYIATYTIFQNQLPTFAAAALIFGGSMFLYSFHRFVGFIIKTDKSTNRAKQLIRNRHVIIAGGAVGIVFCCLGLNALNQIRNWALIASGGLLAIGYVLPVFKGRRLRDFQYTKAFIIAFAWICVCCLSAIDSRWTAIELFFITEKWLFILGLSLTFDIKDLELDKRLGVKTFAGVKGVLFTNRLATACLMGAVICLIPQYMYDLINVSEFLVHIALYMLFIAAILRVRLHTKEWYYWFVLDGSIIVQSLATITLTLHH